MDVPIEIRITGTKTRWVFAFPAARCGIIDAVIINCSRGVGIRVPAAEGGPVVVEALLSLVTTPKVLVVMWSTVALALLTTSCGVLT